MDNSRDPVRPKKKSKTCNGGEVWEKARLMEIADLQGFSLLSGKKMTDKAGTCLQRASDPVKMPA